MSEPTFYVLVNPRGVTATLLELDNDSYIVPVTGKQLRDLKSSDYLNAADNPRLSVIPVVESLENPEEWVEPPNAVGITRELAEEFLERFDELEDPDNSMCGVEYEVDGVKLVLVEGE